MDKSSPVSDVPQRKPQVQLGYQVQGSLQLELYPRTEPDGGPGVSPAGSSCSPPGALTLVYRRTPNENEVEQICV